MNYVVSAEKNMSQLCNLAICKNCEKKEINKPFNWGEGAKFCIVLEFLTPNKAIEKIKKTKCPKCGSKNWIFTDSIIH